MKLRRPCLALLTVVTLLEPVAQAADCGGERIPDLYASTTAKR